MAVKAAYWRLKSWWLNPVPAGAVPPLRPKAFVDGAYNGSVATALESFQVSVFPYTNREDAMLAIEADNMEAKAICNLMADRRYRDHVYGQGGDLVGFLRDAVGDLLVHGIVYTRIEWEPAPRFGQSSTSDGRKVPILPRFSPLQPEGVRPLHEGTMLTGYRITPLLAVRGMRALHKVKVLEEADEQPFRVGADEVLQLASPDWHPGRPPLADFVDDYWRHRVAMNAKLAAFSPPNDHRLRVEASRYRSQRELEREALLADMRIQNRAGASLLELASDHPNLVEPVSDYFLARQHAEVRKRAVQWRGMILREFSCQVLEPLLSRNGVQGKASLNAVGFKDEAGFDVLFGRFLSENLSLEAFMRLCRDE